jgi:hypothetical protein
VTVRKFGGNFDKTTLQSKVPVTFWRIENRAIMQGVLTASQSN